MRNLILIAMSAMALAACGSMPKDEAGNQLVRIYDCKVAIDGNRNVKPGFVVHDHGSGQFGNGMFCYGPQPANLAK